MFSDLDLAHGCGQQAQGGFTLFSISGYVLKDLDYHKTQGNDAMWVREEFTDLDFKENLACSGN